MDAEQEDIFLENFKSLESELAQLARIREDFVSYSRALAKVHYDRLNPVVADPEVFEFLKTAGDLRNILVHRHAVCTPTKEFVGKFVRIVREIKNPARCQDIMTSGDDLVVCHAGNLVSEVVASMKKRGLSHIPVLGQKGVEGVFSRTTFFESYARTGLLEVRSDFTVRDFLQAASIESHTNESYLFASPRTPVYEIYRFLFKREPNTRRLSCVFVTKNGKADGTLVGIITETDLLKAPYNFDL